MIDLIVPQVKHFQRAVDNQCRRQLCQCAFKRPQGIPFEGQSATEELRREGRSECLE